MKILVSKNAGKLADLFFSIFIACNKEYYYEELEKVGIVVDQEFNNIVDDVIVLLGDDIKNFKTYFTVSNIAYSLIDYNKIWELEDLDKYLEYVETIKNYDIQKSIISFIESYKENWIQTMEDERFREIINDNNQLVNFLNDKPISSEEKWTIISIINDVDSFKKTFISLIREYEKKYKVFIKKHEDNINKYFNLLEEEIQKKGIDIDIPIAQFIDNSTGNIERICIMSSYFLAYTFSQTVVKSEKSSYITIGRYLDKLFQAKNRENSVDKYVSVFKNLGDLNRYKFIKLLSQGEKYGQEIADELNITSATVSYHANNLLVANLLKMERYENKTYYSLNKDTLREMISFIKKDLEL